MTSNQSKPGDIEDALKKANFEFKQRRFEKAVPLYEQALEGLLANRPIDHGDTIYCMETLADALAFQATTKKHTKFWRKLPKFGKEFPVQKT